MTEQLDNTNSSGDRTVPWRLIVGVVFLIAFVLFLIENNHRVAIRFVGPRVHASLTIALLIAAALGSLTTLFIQHRRGRS